MAAHCPKPKTTHKSYQPAKQKAQKKRIKALKKSKAAPTKNTPIKQPKIIPNIQNT